MTALDSFTKRTFEIHEGSVECIVELQRINSNISTLGKAFSRIYTVGIDAVNAMIKAMTIIGRRMQGLFITSLASDLLPTLRPILDVWNTEIEEALVSGFEPLKVSILWRLTPPTHAIAREIGRITEGSRKLSIPTYENVATTPSMPSVTPPPTPELMSTISDYMGRISEVGRWTYETAPAMTIRVGVDYGRARTRTTEGVFEAIRRGVMEARATEALEITPRRLGAVDMMQEISEKLVAPAPLLAPLIARKQRYVVDVSGAGRIHHPLAKKVSETYDSRILEPVSKVYEAPRFAGEASVPPKTATEMAKTVRFVLIHPEMGRGLQLITEGAAKASMMGLLGMAPAITEAVAGRVSEAPVRGTLRFPQPLAKRVSEAYVIRVLEPVSKVYEVSRFVGRVPIPPEAHMRPAMEVAKAGRLILAIPGMERGLQPTIEGAAKAYGIGPPGMGPPPTEVLAERVPEAPVRVIVQYAPQIKGIGMLGYDLARRVADMGTIKPPHVETELVEAFLEAKRGALDTVSRKISEGYLAGAPVAWTSSILEVAKVASGHVGRISSRALEGTKPYRLGALSLIPPPVGAVAEGVTKVSGFGIRAPALDRGFDLVEGGVKELPVVVPSVVHRPSTVEIGAPVQAVSEMSRAFDAFSVVLKEFMAKAVSFGVVKAKQLYPSVRATEAVRPLSEALPRVSDQFSRMIGEKYLEIVEAPPMKQYLAVGGELGMVSELNRDFSLMRGRVEELSMSALGVAPPPSTARAVGMVSSAGVAMPEMSRALAASTVLSRMFMDYEVRMERVIRSYLGEMIVTLSRAPVGEQALERIPLETPMNMPTVRLQEIIPLLSSAQAPIKAEMPPTIRRDRLPERPRSITVNVESLRDEGDLRELRRKIAQILREEARRHGVIR